MPVPTNTEVQAASWLGEEGSEALRLLEELQQQADSINQQLEDLLQTVDAPPEAVRLALEVAPADPEVNRTNFVEWIRGKMPSLVMAQNGMMKTLRLAFGLAAAHYLLVNRPDHTEPPPEEHLALVVNRMGLLEHPKGATSVVDSLFAKEAEGRCANARSGR